MEYSVVYSAILTIISIFVAVYVPFYISQTERLRSEVEAIERDIQKKNLVVSYYRQIANALLLDSRVIVEQNYRIYRKERRNERFPFSNAALYSLGAAMETIVGDINEESFYAKYPKIHYTTQRLKEIQNAANIIWFYAENKNAADEMFHKDVSVDFSGGISKSRMPKLLEALSFGEEYTELTIGSFASISADVELILIPNILSLHKKLQEIQHKLKSIQSTKLTLILISIIGIIGPLSGLLTNCKQAQLPWIICLSIFCIIVAGIQSFKQNEF